MGHGAGAGRGPVAEVTGWLPAAEELRAFEGIHLGDEDAFRAVAAPLQPHLRRLAALHVAGPHVDEVVRRSWTTALAGQGMFRWQTPLATWVAGFVVATARAERAIHPPPRRTVPPTSSSDGSGPADWSDLPWSARWLGVGARLDAELDALAPAEREVVHGSDEAGWSDRRVCDVLGLTASAHTRLLAAAHGRLYHAVATHLGADPAGTPTDTATQLLAVRRWLHQRVDAPRSEPLDVDTLEVFRRWSAGRQRRWTRRLGRGRSVSRRAAAPAARRDAPASGTASARPTPT
jgi:DNA-directed RNA polymerase specialized sigma24 family protein